ncbi:MAG: YvcK family protein [Polyangiaceae bacterium]|nr:YvcK family protein [Polyangiaceae bacterium]
MDAGTPRRRAASQRGDWLPRVVTLGGGHGQAALLAALRQLRVEISAVVSVADDGGHSGQLRTLARIPPPGDLRRCLTALARRKELAARFEHRVPTLAGPARCDGNLVLAMARERLGSLQAAVDWAAHLLDAEGRVLPVAESGGVLVVCDAEGRVLSGQSHIQAVANAPLVASVHGTSSTNSEAVAAIHAADLLLLGPGSFFTSTLAAVATAGIARACVESGGGCCFVANLVGEGDQTPNWPLERYVRILRDHLTIGSLGGDLHIEVLANHASGFSSWTLEDGTSVYGSELAAPGAVVHDPDRVARALTHWFGFQRRSPEGPEETHCSADELFARELALAVARFGSEPPVVHE